MTGSAFTPGAVDYNSAISSNYATARAFSSEAAETWSAVLRPLLPVSHRPTILDLGCGTGRFSTLFADRFDVQVVGLDPAFRMLTEAVPQPRTVAYAAARGESLPLRDSSCDVVWLSHVIHHIPDRGACARELHRVVRPRGCVVIRGTFGDRLDGFPTLFRFFPGARHLSAQVPTLDQVTSDFASAGFTCESLRQVAQQTCNSLRAFAGRTRLRADSTLVLLSDEEFGRRQAALDRAAQCEEVPSPVIETLDVLVLRPSDHAAA